MDNPKPESTAPIAYPCTIEEADFSAKTVTLKMTGEYAVSAGQYLLVPVNSLQAAIPTGTIALPVLDLMKADA